MDIIRFASGILRRSCIGSSATISCEPRQARKGATVVMDSGAGVWLMQVLIFQYFDPLLFCAAKFQFDIVTDR